MWRINIWAKQELVKFYKIFKWKLVEQFEVFKIYFNINNIESRHFILKHLPLVQYTRQTYEVPATPPKRNAPSEVYRYSDLDEKRVALKANTLVKVLSCY